MCGTLSWTKQTSSVDATCTISLYSRSSGLVTAGVSLSPTSALFPGAVYVPGGIYLGRPQSGQAQWRLQVDPVTGDLLFQKLDPVTNVYVNKLAVSEMGG